jgi:hypothetical protein
LLRARLQLRERLSRYFRQKPEQKGALPINGGLKP